MTVVDDEGLVPMTRDEIKALLEKQGYPVHNEKWLEEVFKIARLIERAHGIYL